MSSDILTKWAVALEIPVEKTDLDDDAQVGRDGLLGWFERARGAYFERCPSVAEGSFEPRVKTLDMRDREPIGHPDTVLIATSVTELGETWFKMTCRVRSLIRSHGVVADGRCTMEVVDPKTGELLPVPDLLRKDFVAMEMGAQFHS